MFRPDQIPGMIEPVEQRLLTELAASPAVAASGQIVEFGTFFGRSTACLLNGSAAWWSPERGQPAVLAFDSFGFAEGGAFARHVWNFAQSAGVQSLVRRAEGRLDFYPVYQHFVGAAEATGQLQTEIVELRHATFGGGRIGLLHLDAPKFYEELKYVLFRFFPSLAEGGVVVFQDYFYHWSASLVAAAQLLAEAGVLRFESSAATSLVGRVLRTPSVAELVELDLAMTGAPIPEILDRAFAGARALPLDRPEQFAPRIQLAKLQHLWTTGRPAAAQRTLAQMIQDAGGRFHVQLFADFQEMMAYGFDLRKLYELDH